MKDPTQDYFDIQLSFSTSDPFQTFALLTKVAKLYGYEVRKTVDRPVLRFGVSALVRMHQSKQFGDTSTESIERALRKFVDVLSIEMERIDEDDIVWWTKITKVDYEVLVSAMD